MSHQFCLYILLALVTSSGMAQEHSSRTVRPEVIYNWSEPGGYTPEKDLEGSGLAFDSDGHLYMLSEGHGVVLRFASGTSANPAVIPLQLPNAMRNSGKGGFDLEAISILDDEIYVCDEHTLRIYVCDKSDGSLRETLRIEGNIDQRPTGGRRSDGSRNDASQKSIEGLAVISSPDGRGRDFFLLDEHDELTMGERTTYVSHLYSGRVVDQADDGDDLNSARETRLPVQRALTVELGDNEYERLTDLIARDNRLYAIRSVRFPVSYSLVQLADHGKSLKKMRELVQWLPADAEYSSNFEGAAVSAAGHLFLCTDGPGFRKGSWRKPTRVDYRTLLADYGRVLRVP